MIDLKAMPNVKFGFISYEGKSPENNAWDAYVKSGKKPLQWVADKFGKNKCWKVIKAKWDLDKKALKFTLLVNADDSKDVDVTYEEICKELKWKSFKIVGKDSAVPVEMSMEEVSALYTDAVKKTLVKDKKWLKEHPEADPNKKDDNKAKAEK